MGAVLETSTQLYGSALCKLETNYAVLVFARTNITLC